MNNRDWEQFGEEIRRTVQDAVESQDFRKLNQTITDTINQAVGSAAQGVRGFGEAVNKAAQNIGQRSEENRSAHGADTGYKYGFNSYSANGDQRAGSQRQLPALYKPIGGTKAGSVILLTFGYGVGTVMLVLLACSMLGGIIAGDAGTILYQVILAIFAVLTAGCGAMAAIGTSMFKRAGRFQKYIRKIGGREYCNIKELADGIRKPVKFVIKDVERMVEKGWFRQGHLDSKKSCLMLTGSVYEEYLRLEERIDSQRREADAQAEQQKMQSQEMKKNHTLSPEVQKIIDQGDAYIRKIHECNEAIPGEEISAKISRMEMLVDRIFDRVEQSPDTVTDIRKLMEYYLPTTVKLLEAYEQLDKQPVGGSNIETAKQEIEATLDTLNIAFEKLLDDLFQDTAWDVSSDISVLNTILAQEGLTRDGLQK